ATGVDLPGRVRMGPRAGDLGSGPGTGGPGPARSAAGVGARRGPGPTGRRSGAAGDADRPQLHRGPLAFLLGGHIVPTAAVPQSARGRPPVARARVTTHSDALSECGGAAAPAPASPHRSPGTMRRQGAARAPGYP